MASVKYNGKTVSDPNVKKILKSIADTFGKDVNVRSGDRGSVPKGGSTTSQHLLHRAADFHIVGVTDSSAYSQLKTKKNDIFDTDQSYQVIHHGLHTETLGEHLHIGRFAPKQAFWIRWTVEGLTAAGKGVYTLQTGI